MIDISVVIPTCNRPDRLLGLLGHLGRSRLAPSEVIVVDSSDCPVSPGDLAPFRYELRYLRSEKSVCAQRNYGIREAANSWIFLCDDDIDLPPDYLNRLAEHVTDHPEAGAVSGLVLEEVNGRWISQHPVASSLALAWSRMFQLGLWGEIHCDGRLGGRLASYYRSRGNHLSSAGWPVLVDFAGPFFRTPVYALGASLVRKDWLQRSPFDEHLDRHGYGDNYGVAIGFPSEGIHVLTTATVRHRKEGAGRQPRSVAYEKRVLALDRFLASERGRTAGSRAWLIWSLLGNAVLHAWAGQYGMSRAGLKALSAIVARRNPYLGDGETQ